MNNDPKATSPDAAPKTTVRPATADVKPEEVSTEPRSFLVAFLLAMNFGILALRNFYLGDKRTGWIRLGFLLGYILFILIGGATGQSGLLIIGGALGFAAMVWMVVDFFYVYFTVKTDAFGRALIASSRDKKWAKGLFWAAITFAVLYLIAIATFANTMQNQIQKDPSFWQNLETDSQLQQDYNFN